MSTQAACVGSNYEGGKIINHILKSPHCIGYANIQIAMDAPFHGRVADEAIRSLGRSELQFPAKYGYSDQLVIDKIVDILILINQKYPNIEIIIQIARGRSGINMFNEVLKPILQKFGLVDCDGNVIPSKCKVVYGYRSKDYFDYSQMTTDFVFLNIGMFAVLNNVDNICVGKVCNPLVTYDITDICLHLDETSKTVFNDAANILNLLDDIPNIILCGIDDVMPFIVPEVYSKKNIEHLVNIIFE